MRYLRCGLTGLLLSALLLSLTACSKKPDQPAQPQAVPATGVWGPGKGTPSADLPAIPPPPQVPLFKKIHLTVNATSWCDTTFKDMREFLTKALEHWGIRPVTDTEPASATLKVDYTEKKGEDFNLGTGTKINFYLELYVAPPEREVLWDAYINAETPESFSTDLMKETDPCRSRAFDSFQSQFEGPPSLDTCVAVLMGHPDAVKLLLEQANWGKPDDRARQVLEKAGVQPTDPLSRAKIAIARDEIREEYAQFGEATIPELTDAASRVINTGRHFEPDETSPESKQVSAARTAKLTLILKIYRQIKGPEATENFRVQLVDEAHSAYVDWDKIPVNFGAVGRELLTAEIKSLIQTGIYDDPEYGFYNFCQVGQALLLYPPKDAQAYLVEMLPEYRRILLKDYDILKPESRFNDFCKMVLGTVQALEETGDPAVRGVLEETARQLEPYANVSDDLRANLYRAARGAADHLPK